MTNADTKKNKHLTLDNRIEIQDCLYHGMTFKAIGKRIGKDQTTISKEVKKHLNVAADDVTRTDMHGKPVVPEVCPALLKAPFVCNPCSRKHVRCKYRKQFYHAKKAHQEYEALLCESREGIPLKHGVLLRNGQDAFRRRQTRATPVPYHADERTRRFQVHCLPAPKTEVAGILLDNKTAAETARKILLLKNRFDAVGIRFGSIMPIILTDNGGEFADVFIIENGLVGQKETHLFFCDPMQSSQRPYVEKNHTLFRDIVPKGSSFDRFTRDTIMNT